MKRTFDNLKSGLCVLLFIFTVINAKDSIVFAQADNKPLRLGAEFTSGYMNRPESMKIIENAIDDYGIDEIIIHGFNTNAFLTYSDYPKMQKTVNQEQLEHVHNLFAMFKRKGATIELSTHGPDILGFLEAYPEAKIVSNGMLWTFIESSVSKLFQEFKEADSIETWLWESTDFLDDEAYFGDLKWAKDRAAQQLEAITYYSLTDYLTELLSAYSRGAEAEGKEFVIMSFGHHPWQEKILIEAINQAGLNVPITCRHLSQAGDWDPFRPANNVMLECPHRKARFSYDGVGEYWGDSFVPYCYPEEIQQRLWHALDNNPNIEALSMRVFWRNSLFGNFNEINFYALSQLAKNPYMPIEEIWQSWAEKRFGEKASPKVISALKRTNEIGNNIYYIQGIWVQNHSRISDLLYLENHLLCYSQNMLRWKPHDFKMQALIKEVVNNPRENTIEWVLADRYEALRLNKLSLEDIKSVKKSLPKDEYEKLINQFTLQRHYIETCIPHMEAFLRYRIQKVNPSAENMDKLNTALEKLEKKAAEVEKLYKEKIVVLTAKDIRTYVEQVRTAAAKKELTLPDVFRP